jgi:peptide/nickel transport system permease protein
VLRRVLRNGHAVAGIICVGVFMAGAILAPFIAPYGPGGVQLGDALVPPSLVHLMGTDALGRDELSRIVYGARLSFLVSIGATLWGLGLGGALGGLAGGIGGRIDAGIMRVTDLLLAFPGLLLAIGIVSWLGRGRFQIALAVGISYTPVFARLLRGSLLSLQEAEFVVAARAVGVPRPRLLLRHMLPNALAPTIVQATLVLGTAIIDVAGLGFLGLGPPDPGIAEWGAMLIDGVRYLQSAPYLVFLPGTVLVVTVVGFNLLGDGLRSSLDPRLRK